MKANAILDCGVEEKDGGANRPTPPLGGLPLAAFVSPLFSSAAERTIAAESAENV